MSSFEAKFKHKETGNIVTVFCYDDYFGRHKYGYHINDVVMTEEAFFEKYESYVETKEDGHKILGVNKRCYPSENFLMGGYIEVTTVLVAGNIGDYAAYSGHGNPDYVARLGNKIPFAEAQCHFPFIERQKYRD